MADVKPITLEQAKNLRGDTTLYDLVNRNSDGTAARWRVNGAVKTWKRSPWRVQVPIKHGLYDHGYLTEDNLHLFSLQEPERVKPKPKPTPKRKK